MKTVFGRLSRRGAALAVIALTAIGVGAAVAAIPAADGTISGCYNSTNGALRVIDIAKGQTCVKPSETPIKWSQTGPQGQKGDPGTFAGHFASPNGKYSLDITDDGIVLKAPTASVTIAPAPTAPEVSQVTVTGFEEHRGPEDHFGNERHFAFEQHFGQEFHGGFEDHNGSEDHGDSNADFLNYFARERHDGGQEDHHGVENHTGRVFFTGSCSDDPPQFFKVSLGGAGFAQNLEACK